MAGSELLIATLVTTAASAAVQTASSYQNYKGQAKANEANAKILESNAEQAALEGSLTQDAQRRNTRQQLSRQTAAQAQAGLFGGTATESYLQSFANAEQDALNTGYRAGSERISYLNQSRLQRYYGKSASNNARNSIYGNVLGGAANTLSIAGKYF